MAGSIFQPSTAPASSPRVYYPSLDYLRGLAILAVLLYHNFNYIPVFQGGWMGVDLFFVLSGFLITSLLLASVNSKHYFRNFFSRRVLRIFPLYYFFLLLFFAGLLLLPTNEKAERTYVYYHTNQRWFWTYIQNWLMIKKGHASVPYLSHFWSLAVEEQFYILWPFVVYLLRHSRHFFGVILFLIFGVVLYRQAVWYHNQLVVEAFFYNTFCRMDSFLAGALVAVCRKENKRIPRAVLHTIFFAFFLLLVIAVGVYGNARAGTALFGTVGYTISATFFAAVVYVFITKQQAVQQWLKHLHFLRFLGKISYGLYVFHFPVYVLMGTQLSQIFIRFTGKVIYGNLLISTASLLITLLLSMASFYVIETPALRLRRYFNE